MDWSNPVASAVSGGFGLIGSGLSYLFNKKLADQQNQFNLDMWKMQNEYNSPQAQMQRFKDAGLNPNLIYSQGNSGNASSAPQMVTPQAPEISEDMRKLSQAFNIEGLLTARANRKKAEADALSANVDAERDRRILEAEADFSNEYRFNYLTGRYDKTEPGVSLPPSRYYLNEMLRKAHQGTYLLPYKAALMNYQSQYLAPQVTMQNYNAKHYKSAYWIGQGGNIIKGLGGLIGTFNPRNFLIKGQPTDYFLP